MGEPSVTTGIDGKPRCFWCAGHDDMMAYHDTEWGFPVTDDRRLFEKLCLEGFQSGLSWRRFSGNATRSAARSPDSLSTRSPDSSTAGPTHAQRRFDCPSPGKIESAIGNARRARLLADEPDRSPSGDTSPIRRNDPREPRPAGSGRPVQRSEEARMDVRRPDHRHAFMQAMGRQRSRARPRRVPLRRTRGGRCGGREPGRRYFSAARPAADLLARSGRTAPAGSSRSEDRRIATRTSFSTFAPSASTIRRTDGSCPRDRDLEDGAAAAIRSPRHEGGARLAVPAPRPRAIGRAPTSVSGLEAFTKGFRHLALGVRQGLGERRIVGHHEEAAGIQVGRPTGNRKRSRCGAGRRRSAALWVAVGRQVALRLVEER